MLTIQKTTNYSQFKFLKRNRDALPKHLIKSIQEKNLLNEHPIICDKNLNVIDGQHRLKAAEFLKVPIYYIISENISEEDIAICQVQKPWLLDDYLKFYNQKEDYKFVEELMFLYKFPIHLVIACCQNGDEHYENFKSGKFYIKIPKESIKHRMECMKEIYDLILELKKNTGKAKIHISSKFKRVLWRFINRDDYQHDRMKESIQTYPLNMLTILNFNSESMIYECLRDRIYNYKRQKKVI